jgi:hypothetical protein
MPTEIESLRNTLRDAITAMRDAARRLDGDSDPDDVAASLRFAANQYSQIHDRSIADGQVKSLAVGLNLPESTVRNVFLREKA